MKNFNGYIKVTNIPSFIEQVELKLSSKETLREVTKVEFEAYCMTKYGKSFLENTVLQRNARAVRQNQTNLVRKSVELTLTKNILTTEV